MNMDDSQTKLRILLVEDNLSDARLTMKALSIAQLPIEIFLVKDGIEALDFFNRNPPFESVLDVDLILLDLNLPRMDGHELLSRLKSTEEFKNIPVIIFSTSTSGVDRERCFALKANFYLTKPMRFEGFSELVEKVKSFCR
ncbi:MAG: response regulator receiver protein [Bacteriovoracaceae bacterium]|nr:response regulator receiver protein [Bacteriovoracaceae bacterium]